MNFFRTIIGICSGTSVFRQLAGTHPLRAIFHLLVLAFLCSAFIISGRILTTYSQTFKLIDVLEKQFGGISFGEKDGLLPQKNADKPFAYLNNNFRLDYRPSKEKLAEDVQNWNNAAGVLWTPQSIFMWFANPAQKEFYTYNLFMLSGKSLPSTSHPTKEALADYLDKNAFLPGTGQYAFLKEPKKIDMITLKLLSCGIIAFEFLFRFIGTVFLVLFFNGIFTLVSSLSARNADPDFKLSARSMFSVGIYAGFPALLIASCFPALELPYFDFISVYIAGFLFYLFVVLGTLRRNSNPKIDMEA